jgi:hypothetical protein
MLKIFPVPAYARDGARQWKYSCDYYSRFQGLSLYLGPGLSQAVEEFIYSARAEALQRTRQVDSNCKI